MLNRLFAYLTIAIVALLGSTAYGENPSGAPADHFLCYKVKTTAGTPPFFPISGVDLRDEFGDTDNQIKKIRTLCPPADRDGEGVADEATHLFGYDLKPNRFARRTNLLVTNAMGQISLDLTKRDRLYVPTAKSLTTSPAAPDPDRQRVDRYQCYKAQVSPGTAKFPKGITVGVEDQFTNGAVQVSVKRPTRLCAPVEKDGSPVRNGLGHLACYQVKFVSPAKHQKRTGVHLNNELGALTIDTLIEQELCVPSVVNEAPTAVMSITSATGLSPRDVTFDASGSHDPDGQIASYRWDFGDGTSATGRVVTHRYSMVGTAQVFLTVIDAAGGTGFATGTVTLTDAAMGPQPSFTTTPARGTAPLPVAFNASTSTDTGGTITSYAWDFSDGASASGVTVNHTFAGAGTYAITLTVTDSRGIKATTTRSVVVDGAAVVPPNPSTVAPPVDPTVATTVADATAFLYTGATRVQTGVAPGTIDRRRAAVIRGRVIARDGSPLSAVLVSILDHPEYGNTVSRSDGQFDMVVNGGGLLVVDYRKPGLLRAQRQIRLSWQDYGVLPDVAMVPLDSAVTTLNLLASTPVQTAQGSVSTDSDGTRRATLLFPHGTTAEMVMPNGTTQPITTLSVRATEFTVGVNGRLAMPAELPPESAYTYCVVFTADEALAAGATDVRFGQPIPFYVENFIGFPVGNAVPLGNYDPDLGTWIASDNGRVVKIKSITGDGFAELDTDGDDVVDNGVSLGVTADERKSLATLYSAGQTLWRMMIPHFDKDWDSNWGFGPPAGAGPPKVPAPEKPTKKPKDRCEQTGSVIACESQALGESVPITGSPFRLHYQSDRTPGYIAETGVNIPLAGPTFPGPVKRISLEVEVAGRLTTQSFPATPDSSALFTWDGIDAYGRRLEAAQPVTIRIGYVYDGDYTQPNRFGYKSEIPLTAMRGTGEITLWRTVESTIRPWDGRSLGFPGWSLSPHHSYDPLGKVLELGNGKSRESTGLDRVITTVAGSPHGSSGCFGGACGDGGLATKAKLGFPTALGVDRDGSFVITDISTHRVRRVDADGIINNVAGTGDTCIPPDPCGDGGPATSATFGRPAGMALGPDGSIYVADSDAYRLRRIAPDGTISTVAGNGTNCTSIQEGVDATQTSVCPSRVAVAADGSVYVVTEYRIRRIGTDGIIATVAGTGQQCFGDVPCGDGGPATSATFVGIADLALEDDGSVLVADWFRLRRIGVDGIITNLAGDRRDPAFNPRPDEGALATSGALNVEAVTTGADGSIYIAGGSHDHRVYRISTFGVISTFAGAPSGNGCPAGPSTCGDGGPATAAFLSTPSGVTVAPSGDVLIADATNSQIRRVGSGLPGISLGNFLLAAEDGSELYVFDRNGKHLRTLDPLTAAVRYEFAYDAAGRLSSITDVSGNVTTVARPNATQVVITAPGGQQTLLGLDASGFVETIANPKSETYHLTYFVRGLLQTFTDPAGNTSHFQYDSLGRLSLDQDAAGGSKTLVHSLTPSGFTVDLTTELDRLWTYAVEYLPGGGVRRTNTSPAGLSTITELGSGGTLVKLAPDDSMTSVTRSPDPRFQMQAPVTQTMQISIPGRPDTLMNESRTVLLNDPSDLLSLKRETRNVAVNGRLFTRLALLSDAERRVTNFSPEGRQLVSFLDPLGRIIRQEIDGLAPSTIVYNARGLVTSVTQGAGGDMRTYSLLYDDKQRLVSVIDPLSRTTSFNYDAADRVITQTMPGGQVVQFGYDANGNVTSVTPPSKPAHGLRYTPVDTEESYDPPVVSGSGTTSTLYVYNADRQLEHIQRPDGSSVDLAYDATTGLLTTRTLPAGQGQLTYAYDPATGNLASVAGPELETLSYGYQGFLRTSSSWGGSVTGSVSRTYDEDLRVESENINGGSTVTFAYDNDDLLTGAGPLIIHRDPQTGLITDTALGNVTDVRTYDAFGAIASYRASFGSTMLYGVTYNLRDKLGRVLKRTETIEGTTTVHEYVYDEAGRLDVVKRNGVVAADYDYDANGNRTAGPGLTTTPTYDAQDRLVAYGAAQYEYVASGELKRKLVATQITDYEYDALGSLRKVVLPSGSVIDYVLDGEGNRVGKKRDGLLERAFLYDEQSRVVAELGPDGSVLSRFAYGDLTNVPSYFVRGSSTYRIVSDPLGSPRLIVDVNSGAVAQRLDHDEWGRTTVEMPAGFQPFGFAGGLYDADTGFVRFGARDYDPSVGRWTAQDPIRFDAVGWNLYQYSSDDPVNRKDENGLGFVDCQKAIFELKAAWDNLNKRLAEDAAAECPDPGHDKAIEQARNRVEKAQATVQRSCNDPRSRKQLGDLGLLGTLGLLAALLAKTLLALGGI